MKITIPIISTILLLYCNSCNSEKKAIAKISNEISGVWTYQKISTTVIEGNPNQVEIETALTNSSKNDYLILNSDKTYQVFMNGNKENGIWDLVDHGKLIKLFDGRNYTTLIISKIESELLTLQADSEDGKLTLILKKKH